MWLTSIKLNISMKHHKILKHLIVQREKYFWTSKTANIHFNRFISQFFPRFVCTVHHILVSPVSQLFFCSYIIYTLRLMFSMWFFLLSATIWATDEHTQIYIIKKYHTHKRMNLKVIKMSWKSNGRTHPKNSSSSGGSNNNITSCTLCWRCYFCCPGCCCRCSCCCCCCCLSELDDWIFSIICITGANIIKRKLCMLFVCLLACLLSWLIVWLVWYLALSSVSCISSISFFYSFRLQ